MIPSAANKPAAQTQEGKGSTLAAMIRPHHDQVVFDGQENQRPENQTQASKKL